MLEDININQARCLHLVVWGTWVQWNINTSLTMGKVKTRINWAPWMTEMKWFILTEDQRRFTTVLNKAISSHKAKVVPEKQCRNVNKKAFVWIWAHLLARNVFDFLKKSLFQHVSEKTYPTALQSAPFHICASKPGLKNLLKYWRQLKNAVT